MQQSFARGKRGNTRSLYVWRVSTRVRTTRVGLSSDSDSQFSVTPPLRVVGGGRMGTSARRASHPMFFILENVKIKYNDVLMEFV